MGNMEYCAGSGEGDNLKARPEKRQFRSGPRLQGSNQINNLNKRFQTSASHLCLSTGVSNEVLLYGRVRELGWRGIRLLEYRS